MRFTGPTVALVVVASSLRPASAEAQRLDDRVEGAVKALRSQGLAAAPRELRFAFAGDVIQESLQPGAAGAACVTVAAVAATGLSFRLELLEATSVSAPGAPPLDVEASEEGRALVTWCGEGATRAVARVGAGRGAVAFVVAYGSREASRHALAAPSASDEPRQPPESPPPPRRPVPSAEREARFLDESTRDGATSVRARWSVDLRAGQWRNAALDLTRGCHRIQASAERDDGLVDLDGALVDGLSDLVRAADDSSAPAARLDLCVLTDRRVTLRLRSLHRDEEAHVHHAAWPLPVDLSAEVNERLATDVAEAMRRAGTRAAFRVVVAARGSSGKTLVPTPRLAPGCYVAVVATASGRAATMRLDVALGSATASSRKARGAAVTTASVCSPDLARARVTVEALGSPTLSWALWVLAPSKEVR